MTAMADSFQKKRRDPFAHFYIANKHQGKAPLRTLKRKVLLTFEERKQQKGLSSNIESGGCGAVQKSQ